tara:strand:+ start:12156 stop:12530 length:375 start_codon:yes stop_codon:yes gene_type:complete
MSTIKANDIQNASGGIPTVKGQALIPTAWVNFKGTGTVAIRGSENVSSVTDGGTGVYTANFATALADANYVIHGSAGANATNPSNYSLAAFPSSTTTSMIDIYNTNNQITDASYIGVTVFGVQA